MGAENPVASCDLQILVYETTEAISSLRPNRRFGRRAECGLRAGANRAIGVGGACSGDQEVVEALAAQCADAALGDCVHTRCSNRGADDVDVGASKHGAAN